VPRGAFCDGTQCRRVIMEDGSEAALQRAGLACGGSVLWNGLNSPRGLLPVLQLQNIALRVADVDGNQRSSVGIVHGDFFSHGAAACLEYRV